MITLYVFGPAFGLPDASHFVMKTEVQLKMAKLAYRKDPTGFPNAPKGKLPYIEDKGKLVPDSTFIRAYIEKTYGRDLDAGLDAWARAQSWTIERLVEDHLGWAMAYFRWLVPENFEKGPAHFFDVAPDAVRSKLRDDALLRVTTAMKGHGIGRHSQAEVAELGSRSLEALSAMLGDGPFMMGDGPTAVDAITFATLACVLTPYFDTPLRAKAQNLGNLPPYVTRMMERFYPEHDWDKAPNAARAASQAAAITRDMRRGAVAA
jgi:glutathione S-transferase